VSDYKTSQCKGCGREIVWGEDEGGRKIPLDPRPAVYVVVRKTPTGTELLAKRTSQAMVSHFVTCTAANKFSGSKKTNAPA